VCSSTSLHFTGFVYLITWRSPPIFACSHLSAVLASNFASLRSVVEKSAIFGHVDFSELLNLASFHVLSMEPDDFARSFGAWHEAARLRASCKLVDATLRGSSSSSSSSGRMMRPSEGRVALMMTYLLRA